ncbi:hypothetical protein V2J09_017430 [Rumex salicifolius]
MAVSGSPRVLPSSIKCRSDHPKPDFPVRLASSFSGGFSSFILRFPPNFVRQLSTKARRNCSNIGVAQVVAASWSENAGAASIGGAAKSSAKAVDLAASAASTEPVVNLACGGDMANNIVDKKTYDSVELTSSSSSSTGKSDLRHPFLSSDGSIAIHAGERIDRHIATDAITTPVFNTSAYFFKKTADLLDFKFKYRVMVLFEDFQKWWYCILLQSIEIRATVIDPADVEGLKTALEKNNNAAYLIIRGMKTLHLRIQQQNTTAMRMAELLETHPRVKHVYYPGLPSHPEHELAKRQMTGFGGVVSFEIPYIAPSFGGCESIVDQPAIMSYWDLPQSGRLKYGIKDNLVRFSFGVEDFEDLKADILQALESM